MKKRIAIASAVAAGVCVVGLGAAQAASAGPSQVHPVASAATSYRLQQILPRDGELSILRNGKTPGRPTTISVRLTTNGRPVTFLVEEAGGIDLGSTVTVKAGNHATVQLARNVASGTEYNVISLPTGKQSKAYEIKGSIIETPAS